jgi:hypothetical protein
MRRRSKRPSIDQLPVFSGEAISSEQFRTLVEQSESDIQRSIRQYLERQGWWCFRINGGGFYRDGRWIPCYDIPELGYEGHPDLVAYRGDKDMPYCHAFFVEVKRPAEKPRASQKKFIRIAEMIYIPVYVWHSLDEAIRDMAVIHHGRIHAGATTS